MLHGVRSFSPFRLCGAVPHGPRPLYSFGCGHHTEGQWLCYTGDLSRLEDGTWQQAADCIPCTPLVEREAHALLLLDGSGRRLLFDAVFPVLHGKNGEDGTVQGLFELAGVPVIGCGTLSSALCMDKDRAHQLAALAGIRVPRSHVFHSSDDFSRIAQAAEELGYPVFVKPVRAGSSFGITKVSGPEELPAAMEEAFRHDSAVILEETIPGFEVGCAVMGNEELTVGLVDEIALSEGFFNYEEKYTLKTSAIHCPARIPPEKAAEIQAAAKTIYRALDCRVFARVDLFLTRMGRSSSMRSTPSPLHRPQPLPQHDAGHRHFLWGAGDPPDRVGGGGMRTVSIPREQIFQGPLVLVNRAHPLHEKSNLR